MMNDLEKFQALCRAHDWTYEYTDCFATYRRGQAERDQITAMLATLQKHADAKVAKAAVAIWERFYL